MPEILSVNVLTNLSNSLKIRSNRNPPNTPPGFFQRADLGADALPHDGGGPVTNVSR